MYIFKYVAFIFLLHSIMLQTVRGMQDIFGEYQRYFTFLKKVARHEFRKNGFTRISTPIIEFEELIQRSAGDSSDVVSKELYAFDDRKDRRLALKPESTAGVMRSYLTHMLDEAQPVYLYYIEPHFRYDRPQKGRYRQFHQIGAEIIGEQDPVLDAKMMHLGCKILESIGLKGEYTLKINTLGSEKEREKYLGDLTAFFENKKHLLDETDLHRLATNPLRILDSKNEDVKALLTHAPKMIDYIKGDSKKYYEKVKMYLDILGVSYEEDTTLVRGLDYYSHTVWEWVDGSGRTQDAFGGGGRYDNLSKSLGHKVAVPAVGFGMGCERLIEAIMDRGVKLRNKDKTHLYIIQLGEDATKLALPLNIAAQEAGLNSLISLGTPSIKVQMKKANRLGAKYVAIIGIMEAKNGICQLKNMELGTQRECRLVDLVAEVVKEVDPKELDFYSPQKDFVIETQDAS